MPCYSDHNEDIRTKGSCDYCRGTQSEPVEPTFPSQEEIAGSSRSYLGDSVYAYHDGFMLTLTTENGSGPSNTIHLEPEVVESLKRFLDRVANKTEPRS